LDIIVLGPYDPADIQDALVEYDPESFYLERPRDRTASFNKLKYQIPGTNPAIKVDLLLSSEEDMEIPSGLSPNHFVTIRGLSVAPLYFVLYHKLLGWEVRFNHNERWKRDQANGKDYNDIIQICTLLRRQRIRPLSKVHMGRLYLQNLALRAQEFADEYGGEANSKLRSVGFDV
jgi:hypothetical protein